MLSVSAIVLIVNEGRGPSVLVVEVAKFAVVNNSVLVSLLLLLLLLVLGSPRPQVEIGGEIFLLGGRI